MDKKRIAEYENILRRSNPLKDYVQKVRFKDDIVQETAEYALAPALNRFVVYLLSDALERGVKHLFFLARDAYFMYQTSMRYVERYDLSVQCHYICVSRHSLRVPLYHKDMKQALQYICLGGLDVTPEKVLNRADLYGEAREKVLRGIERNLGMDKDAQIPRNRLEELRAYFAGDAVFMKTVAENSNEKYPLLLQYLKQEEFLTNERSAIVDSGWIGSMQKNLSYIREEEGIQSELTGYYFGLYELPDGVKENTYHTYFFGPRDRLKRKVEFSNCLFEGVFSAPHGMTTGYEIQDDRVTPVFRDITEDKSKFMYSMEASFRDYQEVVLHETPTWTEVQRVWNRKSVDHIVEKLLKLLMTMPSAEEAKAYGCINFSDDVLEYKGHEMAMKMSEQELTDNHLSHRIIQEIQTKLTGRKPTIVQSAWYEGSVALYSEGKKAKHHIRSYMLYKYLMQYKKRRTWLKHSSLAR